MSENKSESSSTRVDGCDDAHAEGKTEGRDEGRPDTHDRRPLRILLAEDYEVNRQIICVFLKNMDYRIEEAVNGEQAVEMFKAQPFDLVLMDIQMSVMDGYTATKAIRAWENENGKTAIPIVALTAHAYDQDIRKCLDAGCTAHLSKPVDKRTLLEMIANLTAEAQIKKEDQPHVTVELDIAHLIPTFMEDMTTSCRSIEAAVLQDNLDAIATVCHRIKGTGGMFGFHELSNIGATLEAAAMAGDRAEVKKLSAKLTRHLTEVKIDFK